MHISLPEKLDQDLLDFLTQSPATSDTRVRVIVRVDSQNTDEVARLVRSFGQVMGTLPRIGAISAMLTPTMIDGLLHNRMVKGVEADSLHSIA